MFRRRTRGADGSATLPGDFDGIIVGAPANFWTHQFAGFVWNEQAMLSDPDSYISPAKLPAIQAAALRQCADLEGAKEGVLEDLTPECIPPNKSRL